MAFLEVKNVYKAFGEKEVLKGASFTLEKGEVLAIIGSSGNGKSTLLRILNSLEFADQGEIWLNGELLIQGGKPVKEKELRAKRKHFGMVFQSFHLFPQYNALNNVALAPTVLSGEAAKKLPWKQRKAARARGKEEALQLANDLLDRVGLSDKKENYPCELSGGQCQRVAIARALALSPDVLCFDEPTSALDPELTGEVLKVIRGLKHADRTMILVTHEMQFARSVADKVLFMANGIAEEFGTPEEVFEHPQSEVTKAFLAGYDGGAEMNADKAENATASIGEIVAAEKPAESVTEEKPEKEENSVSVYPTTEQTKKGKNREKWLNPVFSYGLIGSSALFVLLMCLYVLLF